MPGTKRGAHTVENVEERTHADLPKGPQTDTPARVYATCDVLVDELATQYVLGNPMVWDYAMRVDGSNVSVAFLTMAMRGLHIKGEQRRVRDVNAMVDNFWDLHSKYIALSASEIRVIYTDILGHVVSMHETFGDQFMPLASQKQQHLIELLAAECGPPDESEQSVIEYIDELNALVGKGFRRLIEEWLMHIGDIPDSEGPQKDRVSIDMCEKWYFRREGLLDFCVRLIREFIDQLLHPLQIPVPDEPIKAFIQWDFDNMGNFQLVKSKILLAMPCLYDRQRVTELKRTFWDSQAVQGIADNLNKNNAAANKLSALFIYSMVDTGHGIYTLLELQKQRMNGNNKGPNSYDEIIFEHTRIQGPPWRTRNSEWPDDDVMENTNYEYVQSILAEAEVRFFGEELPAAPRNQEPAEEEEQVPTVGAELATVPNEPDEPPPPPVEDADNTLLYGGLVALTAGVAAIAYSRSRS